MNNQISAIKITTFAGIDCSSRELVVCAEIKGKIQRSSFTNDPKGHRQLISWLGKRHCRICIEATGMYHLDACVVMHEAGIEVMILNPRAARDYQRSRNVRAKTDRIDAEGLLDYVKRQEFLPWKPPAPARLQLRQIARRMAQIIESMTRESNRIFSAKATRSTPAVVIRDMQRSVREQRARLVALQKDGLKLADSDPWLKESLQLMRSCKGIANRSALLLLGELCVLPEDMTPRQWVAHAGLDPRPIESGKRSGDKAGPRRISRQGNPRIRAALYMPALVAAHWNPAAKAHYQHLLEKGKAKLVALVSVMRKLLHALWGMLRTRTEFKMERFTQFKIDDSENEFAA
jgi:transposase